MSKSKQTPQTAPLAESKMSAAECETIRKSMMFRLKVACSKVEAEGAKLLADGEAQLAAIYSREDAAWAEVVKEAEKKVEEVNAFIDQVCRERGVPETFRPRLGTGWIERGENRFPSRRAELRRVLESEVAARVKDAKTKCEQDTEHVLTQLISGRLTSEAAKVFLDNMPSVQQLMLPIGSLNLGTGEVILLEGQGSVTPDANRNEIVTADRNDVTEQLSNYKTCALCKKPLDSGRGQYCSNACRQAAHRRRHASAQA
jgi:hypothetical protein